MVRLDPLNRVGRSPLQGGRAEEPAQARGAELPRAQWGFGGRRVLGCSWPVPPP